MIYDIYLLTAIANLRNVTSGLNEDLIYIFTYIYLFIFGLEGFNRIGCVQVIVM